MPPPPVAAVPSPLPRLDAEAVAVLRHAIGRARGDVVRQRRERSARRRWLVDWVGAHRDHHDREHAALDAAAADLDDALRDLDLRASAAVREVLDRRRAVVAAATPAVPWPWP